MRYPSFFLDSKKIRSIRKNAQKSYVNDELTAFFLIRPWSIYISIFIKKHTTISANSITLIMMIFSFIFPLFVFLTENIKNLLILTPTLFYILYSLDMIDGEVARLRNKTSPLGEYYDASLWFSLPILFSIYIYKLCFFLDLPTILFAFALVTISIEVFLLVSQSLFSSNRSVLNFLQNDKSLKGKIILIIKFLLSKQNIYIIYPILYFTLFNKDSSYSLYFFSLLLLVYNMYSIIKFYKIKNSIR